MVVEIETFDLIVSDKCKLNESRKSHNLGVDENHFNMYNESY